VLDGTTGRVVRTVAVGVVGAAPVAAPAVEVRTGNVFVPSSSGAVSLLDGTTGRVVRMVTVGGSPRAAAIDARTRRVFVANANGSGGVPNASGSVNVLDAATGTLRATVPLDASADAVAVDTQANRAFVDVEGEGGGPGSLNVLNATTATVLRSGVGVGVGGTSLAVDARDHRLVAVSSQGTTVSVLDTRSGSLIRDSVLVAGATTAVDVAIDESRSRAVVVSAAYMGLNYEATTVYVLDIRSGRALRHFRLGTGPPALAVDTQRGRIFVVNGSDNSVSVLNATRL